MSSTANGPTVSRWYTRARKFPQVIARFPSGEKIPFGPYTYTEVIAAAVIAMVAYQTRSIWGVFGILGNYAVIAGLLVGTIIVVRMLPNGAQGPLSWLSGVLTLLLAPRRGRLRGPAVRLAKPQRACGAVAISSDPTPTPSPAPAAAAAASVAGDPPATPPPPRPQRSLPLTGVQQLLAGVTLRGETHA